jgi:serine phosphatase RsbU (regulator of sigma subunit)
MGDLSDGLFVTMIFARLNPHDNTLDYASAGHPPAFLISQSGVIKYEMKSTGIPLGVIKDYQYQKSDLIKLESDDTLFFLTDGVFEARSNQKVYFGFDRTLNLIKANQHTSARQLLDLIFQNIRTFSENKPQEDDITLLLCKVNPEK